MIKCQICDFEHEAWDDGAWGVIKKESGGYFFYCVGPCLGHVFMDADKISEVSENIIDSYRKMLEEGRRLRQDRQMPFFNTESIDSLIQDIEIDQAKKRGRKKRGKDKT